MSQPDEIDRIMASALAEVWHGREPRTEDFSIARWIRSELRRANFVIVPATSALLAKGGDAVEGGKVR
jgi:hypothetical protein